MLPIEFTVPGVPKQQGSKRLLKPRSRPAVMVEDADVKPWRTAVGFKAAEAMRGTPPTEDPVAIVVTFHFPRPDAHYNRPKSVRLLKASAPSWVAKAPDLDKLVRAIGDALTGIVYRDDRQIVTCEASKVFSDTPGVHVKAWEVGR